MALFALLGHPAFARDGDHAIGHRIASFHEFAYVDARAHECDIDQCLNMNGVSIDTFWRIKRDCSDLVVSCYTLYSVIGRGARTDYGTCPYYSTTHFESFDKIIKSRGYIELDSESEPEYVRPGSKIVFCPRIHQSILFDGYIIAWPKRIKLNDHPICLMNVYAPHEIDVDAPLDLIEENANEVNEDWARQLCANKVIDFDTYWAYVDRLGRIKTKRAREDEELAELRKRARR